MTANRRAQTANQQGTGEDYTYYEGHTSAHAVDIGGAREGNFRRSALTQRHARHAGALNGSRQRQSNNKRTAWIE